MDCWVISLCSDGCRNRALALLAKRSSGKMALPAKVSVCLGPCVLIQVSNH